MRIAEVRISHYKSLYDVTFQPQGLTVLVGPNNAGKSNLADALDFLAEIYQYGLEIALQRRGGVENIAFRSTQRSRQSIRFAVRLVLEEEDLPRSRRRSSRHSMTTIVEHAFAFQATTRALQTGYRTIFERFAIIGGDAGSEDRYVEVIRNRNNVEVFPSPNGTDETASMSYEDLDFPFKEPGFNHFLLRQARESEDLLLLWTRFNVVLDTAIAALREVKVYQLAAIEGRKSGTPTPSAFLERHGGNLPTVVSHLQRNKPEVWSTILTAMRRTVPALQDIKVLYTSDRRLMLEFEEAGVGRGWNSAEISDGTIQSLAMFVALSETPGPMLVIEEPENSIHPWILRNVIDFCRTLTGRQVVLTTHSPVVLNYVSPTDVMVIWRAGGRSHLSPLTIIDPRAESVWHEGKALVFDILDSGLIPESIPGGRDYAPDDGEVTAENL